MLAHNKMQEPAGSLQYALLAPQESDIGDTRLSSGTW